VYWLWGPTGVGKTRSVYQQFGYDDVCVKPESKWIFDYSGQKCCLVDDFRGSWWKFDYLLRFLDAYPFTIETKGGDVNFNSPVIVITTPDKPSLTFQQIQEDLSQLERRITKVFEYKLDSVLEDVYSVSK
jgi:hypothetical protein